MNSAPRSLAVILIAYLLLGLESPLLHQLHISLLAPDVTLVIAVWLGLHFPPVAGCLTSLAIGFLKDGFVSTVPVGMHAEIFVTVFFFARLMAGRVLVRGVVTLMLTAALASMAATLLYVLFSLLFDRAFSAYAMVFRLLLPSALVTAPFAPIVFFLLDRVDRVLHRRGGGGVFLGGGS